MKRFRDYENLPDEMLAEKEKFKQKSKKVNDKNTRKHKKKTR